MSSLLLDLASELKENVNPDEREYHPLGGSLKDLRALQWLRAEFGTICI